MKKRILIVIGAAAFNRGSEALLNGLIQICNKTELNYITVSSADLKNNERLGIDYVDKFLPRYNKVFNKRNILRFFNIVRSRIGFSDFITKITCGELIKKSNEFDLVIIIGADNLDSKSSYKKELNSLIDIISKNQRTKLMLYNCSIQRENINKYLLENLSNCDIVTARDKLSYENLKKHKEKNLYYITDPAFTIKPAQADVGLPECGTFVGLNVSNKVADLKGSDRYSLVLESYHKLIDYIVNTLELKVVLIPHVMNNADISVLTDLYIKYKGISQDVLLINNEELNSKELKYIISKCRYFVGARTHSTIAAYSSCVPTLVLGYSIKSVGIAKDLFGTENHYVISSHKLKDSNELLDGFKWLVKNEDFIRQTLENTINEYSDSAWKVFNVIDDLFTM